MDSSRAWLFQRSTVKDKVKFETRFIIFSSSSVFDPFGRVIARNVQEILNSSSDQYDIMIFIGFLFSLIGIGL